MGGQHVKNDPVTHSSARSHDFGEKVLCMQTVKRDGRLCSRSWPGVILVGRRRLLNAESKDPELLLTVRGVPWAHSGGDAVNLDQLSA